MRLKMGNFLAFWVRSGITEMEEGMEKRREEGARGQREQGLKSQGVVGKSSHCMEGWGAPRPREQRHSATEH